MSKNGHSNPTFIGDSVVSDKATKRYSLELAEKGGKTVGVASKEAAYDYDYNPYENREVEHPTT